MLNIDLVYLAFAHKNIHKVCKCIIGWSNYIIFYKIFIISMKRYKHSFQSSLSNYFTVLLPNRSIKPPKNKLASIPFGSNMKIVHSK